VFRMDLGKNSTFCLMKNQKIRFFIAELESVNCTGRTESLNNTDMFRLYKVNERFYTRNSVICI